MEKIIRNANGKMNLNLTILHLLKNEIPKESKMKADQVVHIINSNVSRAEYVNRKIVLRAIANIIEKNIHRGS